MRLLKTIILLSLVIIQSGCFLLPEQIDMTKDWSAGKLYSAGKAALNNADYEGAIDYYEKLIARYPFGRHAQQAQLEMAYAYYKWDEPESAISTLERFVKIYPRHPNVDYAYYLKGLVNFNRGKGLVEKYLPTDASQRDPGAARQAFLDFSELLRRHPDSKYAEDARLRMIYLRNNLAAYEIHVARYYIRRGAYAAAANRAKYVIEHYQKAPAVKDALLILSQSYDTLGMNELSEDARRVYKANFKGPMQAGEEPEPGWLDSLMSLFE